MTLFLFQTSKVEFAQFGEIFNTIVEVFLFFDKNGDGKLNKKDIIRTLNETSPLEKSPAHITEKRFSNIIYFTSMLLLTFCMLFNFFFSPSFSFFTCFDFPFWLSSLQKKWTGTRMGRSLLGSSSLVSSNGLGLMLMNRCTK